MCEAKPGPRCAPDTCTDQANALGHYDATHPNGPDVSPLAGAEAEFGSTSGAERELIDGERRQRREPQVLLRTVHGSHLYGLAHADSDDDVYVVIDQGSRRAKQKIVGKDDVTVVTLGEFVRQVHKGVPQAIEALYSPVAEQRGLDAYRHHFHVDTAAALSTYTRTIKRFTFMGFKPRRHALRLAHNLSELAEGGRANPRLPQVVADRISALAAGDVHRYVEHLRAVAPVDPFGGDGGAQSLENLRAGWDA